MRADGLEGHPFVRHHIDVRPRTRISLCIPGEIRVRQGSPLFRMSRSPVTLVRSPFNRLISVSLSSPPNGGENFRFHA